VQEYTLKTSATFLKNALVKLTSGEVEESGSDPAAVLGIAADPTSQALPGNVTDKVLGESDKIGVYVADEDAEFSWEVQTTTPTNAHLGVAYGVVKASNVWYIDLTETSATVVKITRLDPVNTSRAYAKFGGGTVVLSGSGGGE
jgi:hypothetical protein